MKCHIRITSFLLALLLLLLSASLFSSCQRAEPPPAFVLPESFDTDREYHLTFWAKNDSDTTQALTYKQAVADFEKLYPNIHVTVKPYTSYPDIYKDVIINIQTGTTPNICITYPDHISTYNSGDELVVNLDNLLTDPRYGLGGSEIRFDAPTKEEIVPKFLAECYLGGSCYALPFMRSTEACYINKTYVEKLGYTLPETLTWDFVWEVSEAAMKKNADGTFAVNGKKALIPFIYKSTDNMMIQMLKQKGAGYSDEHGNILIFNDDTKDILLEIAGHAKTRAFSTFEIESYPANHLNRGECIFAIDSTAGATWMGTNSPKSDIHKNELVDYEITVKTIPQVDPENPLMISQGPSVCIFNKKDPQEVLASWLFVQYLLSNETQIAYAQTEGYVPTTLTAQKDPAYLDYLSRAGEDNKLYYDVKLQATKLLIENTENTFITPAFNGSADLRSAAGELIEEVTKGTQRNKKVDDTYVNTLFKDMIFKYEMNATIESSSVGAIALLTSLGVTWVGIGTYFVIQGVKSRKKKKIRDKT